MDDAKKVLDAMKKAGEPVGAAKIAEMTGMDKKAVDKVMNLLKKEDKIVSPKRCLWEPK